MSKAPWPLHTQACVDVVAYSSMGPWCNIGPVYILFVFLSSCLLLGFIISERDAEFTTYMTVSQQNFG